jgi:hypothetical protein
MYYLYGETVIYYFKHVLLVDKVLLPFATHHRFIRLVLTWPFNAVADSSSSFMLYIMGAYNPWDTGLAMILTSAFRLCLLRRLSEERALPLPGKSPFYSPIL